MPPNRSRSRNRSTTSERGVSPVIGVLLLVAIAVVLAGLLGVMASGFGNTLSEPAPNADFDTEYDPSGSGNGGVAYVNLSFEIGENMEGSNVLVVDSDGNREHWVDIWYGGPEVEAGQFVHIDGKGSDCELNAITEGEVYKVVWKPDNTTSAVLVEHEIEEPPDTYTGPHTC